MDKDEKSKGERIAKVIARAGVCSRRDAERLIENGQVKVNGQVLSTPATLVTDKDKIIVSGKPLPVKETTRLFLYHKPAGLVTTARDEKGRKTVFDALPAHLPRVVSVGRLDLNTEGLLLLTNDGGLARYLELPATGWVRRYRVRAYGKITQSALDTLQKGITVDDIRYGPITALLEKAGNGDKPANVWMSVSLSEGKNREIRKVLEFLGLEVSRLIRLSYGPFELGKMEPGTVKEISETMLHKNCAGYFAA